MRSLEGFNPEQGRWIDLVKKLKEAKGERENATLERIIHLIKEGKIQDAKNECENNADKITTWFPEAVQLLGAKLFAEGESNPFKFYMAQPKKSARR